ncbi:MAG: hypothetical protein ACE15C_11975 [Phycisphaerae bacterium]
MAQKVAIALLILSCGGLFLACGCMMVSKQQYDKAIADLEQSRQEARQYKLQLDALRGKAPADIAMTPGRPDISPRTRTPSTLPAGPTDLGSVKPPPSTEPSLPPELAARMRALIDAFNPDPTSRPSPAVEPVTGKITAVKDDMAAIDVGASKGIKSGQRLYIYRGGKFVGFLIVEHVEANGAAGVISEKQVAPAAGDKVTNTLE